MLIFNLSELFVEGHFFTSLAVVSSLELFWSHHHLDDREYQHAHNWKPASMKLQVFAAPHPRDVQKV